SHSGCHGRDRCNWCAGQRPGYWLARFSLSSGRRHHLVVLEIRRREDSILAWNGRGFRGTKADRRAHRAWQEERKAELATPRRSEILSFYINECYSVTSRLRCRCALFA